MSFLPALLRTVGGIHAILITTAVAVAVAGVAATVDGNGQEREYDPRYECGVWLAQSTVPGAGLGVFAGRDYRKGDILLQDSPDLLIPVVDMELHNIDKGAYSFLWDEYTWSPDAINVNHHDGVGLTRTSVASIGMGSVTNSHADLINVELGNAQHRTRLHRAADPGAGAMSYDGDRRTQVIETVKAGDELFLSYGPDWFSSRKYKFGAIPDDGEIHAADELTNRYESLRDGYMTKRNSAAARDMWNDLWTTFLPGMVQEWESGLLAVIPQTYDEYQQIVDDHDSIQQYKRHQAHRSQDWFLQNGACADHLYQKESTIRQAGYGAFARRLLPKDSVVLPLPMIPVPSRSMLYMYELGVGKYFRTGEPIWTKIKGVKPRSFQLMFNYCFGNKDSTVLLCPYGPMSGMVNHNQTQANVRLQWAAPHRSNHNASVLQMSPAQMEEQYSANVAMELIALRDIDADEEIFLDYGDLWDKAWRHHVSRWRPLSNAQQYVSPEDLNAQDPPQPLRYGDSAESHLQILYHGLFDDDEGWRDFAESGGNLTKYVELHGQEVYKAEILSVRIEDGRHLYTANLTLEAEEELDEVDFDAVTDGTMDHPGNLEYEIVVDKPREAFIYANRAYTGDAYQSNVFRFFPGIPDEIFPDAWRNIKRDFMPPRT